MMVHSNAFVFARARFRENGEEAGVRPQALLPGALAATVEAKGARLGRLFRMKSNRETGYSGIRGPTSAFPEEGKIEWIW